jgi:antitoxin component YwqK of YwqJK toxin-antitoxin module
MRYILLLVSLLKVASCYSQSHFQNGKTVTIVLRQSSTSELDRIYLCDDSLCDGWLEERDSNNQVTSRAQFSNGKQNGIFQQFYPNGNLKLIGNKSNNCTVGIMNKYYSTGMLKSTEYYPSNTCCIIEGTEMISFYENSNIETWYIYNENWNPQFHYYFSEAGDTLSFMRLLKQDTFIFEEVDFHNGVRISRRLFEINSDGDKKYIEE